MNIVIPFIYSIIILLCIQKWSLFKFEGISTRWFQLTFLIKLGIGCALYLLYTKYYPNRHDADIFKYFDDSKIIYDVAFTKPIDFIKLMFGYKIDTLYFKEAYLQKTLYWHKIYGSQIFNNNRTMIRLNVLIRFISGGYYSVHVIIMCFLALVGQVAFLRAFKKKTEQYRLIAISLLILIPSTLLWSSGVLKESLLFLWIGLLFLLLFNKKSIKKWKFICTLLLLIYLIFITKYYLLAGLLPAIVAYLIVLKYNLKPWKVYASVFSLVFVFVLLLSITNAEISIFSLLAGKHNDMIGHAQAGNANSLYHSVRIGTDVLSVILYAPKALFHSIFQPTPGAISNSLGWIAFLETYFIIALNIIAIWFRKKSFTKDLNLLWFLITICIFTLLVIGITTPIAGSLVRYRVILYPLWAMLILIIIDYDKLVLKIPILKKWTKKELY